MKSEAKLFSDHSNVFFERRLKTKRKSQMQNKNDHKQKEITVNKASMKDELMKDDAR